MGLILFVLKVITFIAIRLYSLKFRPLIIRKNTSDSEVFMSIFIFREFALPIKVQPELIVDAGAYTGLSALYFSSKYPKAKIISIEPEDSNFKVLEQHTTRLPQVTRIHAGLWYRNGFLKIVDRGTGKWGFGVAEVSETEQFDIKAVDMQTLLEKSGFDKIDILKLDIEGAEKFLFMHDAHKWIDKVNIMMIELHDRIIEDCTESLYAAIHIDDWNEHKDGEKVVLIRKKFV